MILLVLILNFLNNQVKLEKVKLKYFNVLYLRYYLNIYIYHKQMIIIFNKLSNIKK